MPGDGPGARRSSMLKFTHTDHTIRRTALHGRPFHPREDEMESRLKDLAEQLDAGLIARREFLRKAAVITGGTAAGLGMLGKMAHAQSGTKLRVWLFKSFVTASNDVLAKQVEA